KRAGAGAGCRSTIRVAEKNLDRDWIGKQRLVNPDGPQNRRLNGRGDRAVECWINDQPSGSLCGSRSDIGVAARTGGSVRTNPIIVGCAWLQSGYSSAIYIANVQAAIAVHVTAEGVAPGDIQQVAFRAAYGVPSRHEAAARRRRRRNRF